MNEQTKQTQNTQTEMSAKTKAKEVTIVREGNQITLPKGMSYAEGREWLTRQEQAEEQPINFSSTLKCFPLDGAIALMKAVKDVYGFTGTQGHDGFFGPTPPRFIEVADGKGGLVSVFWGKLLPPKWEGGFIQTQAGQMSLTVGGIVKRKFEDEAKALIQRAEHFLKTESLYKGRAISLDLSWIEREEEFHPIKHAPTFIDVTGVKEENLILNDEVLSTLQANPWLIIERTDDCRANNVPLKYGCLFAGNFGTGKTLCGRVTAAKCEANGWTFIELKTTSQFATALKLAEMYAPAAVYVEDIDEIVSGDRDAALNEIFNTMDGVGTKDKPIISILTTNNVDNIHAAMMRAGRIDKWIEFEAPDARSAFKFVQLYGKSDKGENLMVDFSEEESVAIGESLEGVIPAFIAEAVQTAKRLAMRRHGRNIVGKVTADDIVKAANAQRKQREKVNNQKLLTPAERAELTLGSLGHILINSQRPLPQLAVTNGQGHRDE